jgi:hypothetical protein
MGQFSVTLKAYSPTFLERLSGKWLEGSLARMFGGTQGAKRASGCTFIRLGGSHLSR